MASFFLRGHHFRNPNRRVILPRSARPAWSWAAPRVPSHTKYHPLGNAESCSMIILPGILEEERASEWAESGRSREPDLFLFPCTQEAFSFSANPYHCLGHLLSPAPLYSSPGILVRSLCLTWIPPATFHHYPNSLNLNSQFITISLIGTSPFRSCIVF